MASIKKALEDSSLDKIKEANRVKKIADTAKNMSYKNYLKVLEDSGYKEQVINDIDIKLDETFKNNIMVLKNIERDLFGLSDMDIVQYFDEHWFNKEKRTFVVTESLLSKLLSLKDKYYDLVKVVSSAITFDELRNNALTKMNSFQDLLREYGFDVHVVDDINAVDFSKYKKTTIFFVISERTNFSDSFSEYVYDYDNKKIIEISQHKIDYQEECIEPLKAIISKLQSTNKYYLQNNLLYEVKDYIDSTDNSLNIKYRRENDNSIQVYTINPVVTDYRTNEHYNNGTTTYNILSNIEEDYYSFADESSSAEAVYHGGGGTVWLYVDINNQVQMLKAKQYNRIAFSRLTRSTIRYDTVTNNSIVAWDSSRNKYDILSINALRFYTPATLVKNIHTYKVSSSDALNEGLFIDQMYLRGVVNEVADFSAADNITYHDEIIEIQPNNVEVGGLHIHTTEGDYHFNLDIARQSKTAFDVKNRLKSFSNNDNDMPSYTIVDKDNIETTKQISILGYDDYVSNAIINPVNIDSNLYSCYLAEIIGHVTFRKFDYNNTSCLYYINGNRNEDSNVVQLIDDEHVTFTANSKYKIYGNNVRNIISLSSDKGDSSNLTIDSYINNKQYLRWGGDKQVYSKDKLTLNANVESSITITTTDQSISYILYAEYPDFEVIDGITGEHVKSNPVITINGKTVKITENGYFEYIFEPHYSDTLKIKSNIAITLENIKVDAYNGITNYALQQLFINTKGYELTDTKWTLQRKNTSPSIYVNADANTITMNGFSYTMKPFLSEINNYLTTYGVNERNVITNVTYTNNDTLNIYINKVSNIDTMAYDENNKTITIADKSYLFDRTLIVDKMIYEESDDAKYGILSDDNNNDMHIHLPKTLNWHNRISLVEDTTNTSNLYTRYGISVADYYENGNSDNIKKWMSDYYINDYEPFISSHTQTYHASELGKVFKTLHINLINGESVDFNIYNSSFVGNYPVITKTESLSGYEILENNGNKDDIMVNMSQYFSGKYLNKDKTVRLVLHNDLAFSVILFCSYKTQYTNKTVTEFMTLLPNKSKILSNVYGYAWYIYKYGEMEDYVQEEDESWTVA